MNRAFAVALVSLAALAGCGDDDETTVTVEETVTQPGVETTTGAQTGTAAQTTTEAAAEARPVDEYPFRSPSGNIGCYINTDGVGCAVDEGTYTAPPRPKSCELEWGRSLGVDGSSPGEFTCVGGILAPPGAPKLPYGEALSSGPFRCDSREDGIECRNEDTDHGFFISRQEARPF